MGIWYDDRNDHNCIVNPIDPYMKNKIRIGCGAGFSGDRVEPALILAEKGELDYLVLECLAERTIALAQKRKMQGSIGYDVLLEKRIRTLMHAVKQNRV